MSSKERLSLLHSELLKPTVDPKDVARFSVYGCDWLEELTDSVVIKCTGLGGLQAASKQVWYRAYDLTTLTEDSLAIGPRVPTSGDFEFQIHVPKRTTYYVLYLR